MPRTGRWTLKKMLPCPELVEDLSGVQLIVRRTTARWPPIVPLHPSVNTQITKVLQTRLFELSAEYMNWLTSCRGKAAEKAPSSTRLVTPTWARSISIYFHICADFFSSYKYFTSPFFSRPKGVVQRISKTIRLLWAREKKFVMSSFPRNLQFFICSSLAWGKVNTFAIKVSWSSILSSPRVLRALGLLLADGAPTVGWGKTHNTPPFWPPNQWDHNFPISWDNFGYLR